MADTTVIAAKIQVDATDAAAASKSLSEMKDNVKQLQKVFEDSKAGTAGQTEAFKKLKAAQDELKISTDNANKTFEASSGHFKNLKEGLGNVNPALAGASEGVGTLSTAFKALLANPVVLIITLIVGALALLYKAFTNTFEGAEKVEQIFAGVKAAAQALFDNLSHIASAIIKFFSFDFSGAVDEIKQVVGAVADAYSAMAKLTAQAQELHKEQLKNDLEQAERAKQLAVLREQATDESVPIAKRKAALIELKKLAEANAKEDVDLAKRTAENKIAQLTLEKDGIHKNQDEINAAKIEAINVETQNANELRRIGKQLTAADKAEKAEQAANAKAAAEEAKKRRQELVDFTNKLTKITQENELLTITDSYQKELKALSNKLADEKRQNDLTFQDKKISRDQLNKLNSALDIQYNLQLANAQEKHNKEVQQKEVEFQKDLSTIVNKTKLDGLGDQRKAEQAQLEINHQNALNDAIKKYKDDAVKLNIIREALAAEFHAEQQKLQDKFKKEDDLKQFKIDEEKKKAIAANKEKTFKERLQAVDDEQSIVQKAFDHKVIAELDYNTKVAELANARKTIRDEEEAHHAKVASAIGQTFGNLAQLAGKQTAIGKAFAIAQTTIDTYTSAIAAYKSLAGIPVIGPALGAVAAAAAIANGIAAVKNIVAVQVPGQGAGGGSAPTAAGPTAPAAPVTPTQTSTKLNQSSLNQAGSAVPVRAFVVDADVQNHAERNSRLSRAARLGG